MTEALAQGFGSYGHIGRVDLQLGALMLLAVGWRSLPWNRRSRHVVCNTDAWRGRRAHC